jgi:hypothetical protein
MARTRGAKNKRNAAAILELNGLAEEFQTNPARTLYAVSSGKAVACTNSKGEEVSVFPTMDQQLDACRQLMPYFYSRKTETSVNAGGDGLIQLVVDMKNEGEFELPTEAAADSSTPTH